MLINFWHAITTSILPFSYLIINAIALYYLCKFILVGASFIFAFGVGVVKTLRGDDN